MALESGVDIGIRFCMFSCQMLGGAEDERVDSVGGTGQSGWAPLGTG